MRSRATSDGAFAIVKQGTLELTSWLHLDAGRPVAQAAIIDPVLLGGVAGIRIEPARWGRRRYDSTLAHGQVAHNCHSALALLRGWRSERGVKTRFYMRGRHEVLRLDLTMQGAERIVARHGTYQTVRIDGTLTVVDRDLAPMRKHASRPVAVWIEYGGHHVPVRIVIGTAPGAFQLELSAARHGTHLDV